MVAHTCITTLNTLLISHLLTLALEYLLQVLSERL